MRRTAIAICTLIVPVLFWSSCTVTLNGAWIPGEMKTINVEYFENNAQLVVNNLSQNFTESLKARIRSSTRLSIVQGDADGHMSGTITGYTIEPISVQATQNNVAPRAGGERLTITVNVIYSYPKDKKYSFTQSFSEYQDFSGDISSQEQNLINSITKKLTDDIFNKAFANW
ncbi:MAG: LptE family protein [Bacteroidetes bacterium]|nr:LptE family protein [Bacteroidota bacterium]